MTNKKMTTKMPKKSLLSNFNPFERIIHTEIHHQIIQMKANLMKKINNKLELQLYIQNKMIQNQFCKKINLMKKGKLKKISKVNYQLQIQLQQSNCQNRNNQDYRESIPLHQFQLELQLHNRGSHLKVIIIIIII